MNTTVLLLHEPRRKQPWVVRWYGDPDPQTGKQKRYGRLFRYIRDAKAFQAEKQTELNRGAPRDPVDATLEELVAEYEEARLAALSYASKIAYRNTTEQLLTHFGRNRRVRDIHQRHAEAFIASRKRCDGKPQELSSWPKARHLIHCRALFQAAVEWGYTDQNPFKTTTRSGSSPLCINAKGRPWDHIMPESYERFLDEVPTARQRAVYWLQYGCGLRAGEVYNLMVANIDLDRRRVHVVNRAATEDLPPFTVKAERQSSESKERSVPIPEAAIPDLAEAMKRAFRSGGFIAITPERFKLIQERWRLCREGEAWGGHDWRPWQNRDMINNVLRDAKHYLRKAGIELTAPFTLHTFRKSFAQNHADAGTPPKTLAKLLGHANTRITLQFYNRVTDANEQAAGRAMDRLFKNAKRKRDTG